MKNRTEYYILNRVFLLALFFLLFNDFYLKVAFPSFLSGKLSDLSGLIVFVLFFTFLFGDRFKKLVFITTTLLFCWWKSSLSDGFILNWNVSLPFYSIERVIDYTDLFCLAVLIPVYFYQPKMTAFQTSRWLLTPLLLLTVFAISATSKARDIGPYSATNTKTYVIGKSFKIKEVTYGEFLQHLTLSNMKVEKKEGSVPPKKPGDYHYYVLGNYEIMDGINVVSMNIGIREKNGNLKLLIQDITLYDPPEKPEKEVREQLVELFEEFFAIGK